MKKWTVGDFVFLEVATTVCYLAIMGKTMDPLFLGLVGTVFGAYFAYSRAKGKASDTSNDLSISDK